ncbi:MAG: helix-turn-helix transcriptional regulator [Treponemataceae bacterium]|nr:helix-turn-helix transcriptional regulator [Treponemataceae bacterium]
MNQDDVRKILSQNIKKRRKELGITQSKLAELADISEPYMNDIERCQTWISDKTLAKLARALNLEIHELFISDNAQHKKTKKDDIYLLFKNHKKGILDYLDKSFDDLYRNMTDN